jgi:hypothetical protein
MKDDFKGIWKRQVETLSKFYTGICLERLKKTKNDFSDNNHSGYWGGVLFRRRNVIIVGYVYYLILPKLLYVSVVRPSSSRNILAS